MKLQHKALSILLLIIIAGVMPVCAQNLVKNNSFEDTLQCIQSLGDFEDYVIKDWNNPTGASPDYFHPCKTGLWHNEYFASVPKNYFGYQNAVTGIAYAGFYVFLPAASPNFREYIQTKLKKPLEIGKKYFVRCFVSLVDSAACGVSTIGLYFSKDKITTEVSDEDTLSYTPQITNPIGNIITDKNSWTLIKGEFIGNGESYLTIGNFKPDNETDTLYTNDIVGGNDTTQRESYENASYYYIDEIFVSDDSTNWLITSLTEPIQHKEKYRYDAIQHQLILTTSISQNCSIYNSFGQLIKSLVLTLGTNLIDTSDWQKGIYFLQIQSTSSSLHYKFIIF